MKKTLFTLCVLLFVSISLSAQQHSTELTFNPNGKFKIAQFTDVHYVVNSDDSKKSIKMMNDVLDAEKPDLVVLTGDIVTSKPQKKGWDEVLSVMIDRHIPYAVVLGNHDDEHDWTREQIMDYVSAKPYSLTDKGPDYLKGFGNYVLTIKDNAHKVNALLYCMDSNAYSKIDEQKGYDSFGFNQVQWYRDNNSFYTTQNNNVPYPALAFFHIPLHEYTLLSDTTKNYVKPREAYGQRNEKECPGILNTGMFAAMVQGGDVMGTFVGHDHDNNYIGYLNGVCLAYGKFSGSKTTYTNSGYGARIIELTQGERAFDTWIRTSENRIENSVKYPDSFSKPQ